MSNRLRVFAPASASNLGPGFDVIGLALDRPGDVVEVEATDVPGVQIVEVTGAPSLSADPAENTAGVAAAAVLRHLDPGGQRGVRLWLHKRMPLASGLGSSAASSVAGAVAVNQLFGGTLSTSALFHCALEGEVAASGTMHADNVAPSLLGGIVLIRSCDPPDLVSLPVPAALRIVVIHPHAEVETAAARRLVAESRFEIGQAVANLGNFGAMISALHSGDLALFGRSISDALVEPIRMPLVPAFREVKAAAVQAGALGCSISGSGPSVFAFADSDNRAEAVADAMQEAFGRANLESDRYLGPVNTTGARALTQSDDAEDDAE
jgi:homoserine kinase